MTRRWLVAEVRHGGVIPHRGLGLAWRRFDRDTAVYVLMPFNLVCQIALRVWWWARLGLRPSAKDAVYDAGVAKGRQMAEMQWAGDRERYEWQNAWLRVNANDAYERGRLSAIREIYDRLRWQEMVR